MPEFSFSNEKNIFSSAYSLQPLKINNYRLNFHCVGLTQRLRFMLSGLKGWIENQHQNSRPSSFPGLNKKQHQGRWPKIF
jgi:hypothetical protein